MSDFAVMPINEYVDICDAVRAKTGETSTIKSGEMPEKIDKVFEEGKKSEWSTFWDALQQNGERTNYNNEFGRGWNDDNFKPKYDIKIKSQQNLFQFSRVTNLKQILIDCGVSLDTSNAPGLYYFADNSSITHSPEVGSLKKGSLHQHAFRQCRNLVSVDKFIMPTHDIADNYGCDYAFQLCGALTEIRFNENIAPRALNFQYSPLSHDSIMSLVNALADKSENTGGTVYSVTLGNDNLAKLTDAEKAIATQKGWSLA